MPGRQEALREQLGWAGPGWEREATLTSAQETDKQGQPAQNVLLVSRPHS